MSSVCHLIASDDKASVQEYVEEGIHLEGHCLLAHFNLDVYYILGFLLLAKLIIPIW